MPTVKKVVIPKKIVVPVKKTMYVQKPQSSYVFSPPKYN